ncbi:hypothetical protein PZA11_002173 [Diplocarpon coronariae]
MDYEFSKDCEAIEKDVLAQFNTKSKIIGQTSIKNEGAKYIKTEVKSTQEDVQHAFPVDQRSFKVLKTLFFVSDQKTDMPIRIHKLYGSVWHFVSRKLDMERDLNFHEPDPYSKIPCKIASVWDDG